MGNSGAISKSRFAGGRGLVVVAAFVVAASACGSSRTTGAVPEPALSRDPVVQEEYKRLLRDFIGGGRGPRLALEPALKRFIAAHPGDGTVRGAMGLLAWIVMESGDLARAEDLALRVQFVGAGATADFARVVQGAVQRRRGNADAALAILDPLVSKLVDPYARDILNEEIVMAAVAAHHPRRALDLMGIWLRETGPEDADDVAKKIAALLDGVPTDEQLALLERAHGSDSAEAKVSLRRTVALRVAAVALARKDSRLAVRVLTLAGGLLGEDGDAVAQLAAGKSRARVEARTIGLLLSLRSSELRQRGVEVAAGVATGLGLPAKDTSGKTPTLVSRDDAGSLDHVADAIGSLSADGAAIVIAGVDELEAEAVLRAASAAGLAALLVRPPKQTPLADGFGFVLGPSPSDVEQALTAELAARGGVPLLLLSDAERATATEVAGLTTRRCDAAASAEAAHATPTVSIALGPSESCARALAGYALSPKARFGFSFETFGLPATSGSIIASAGLFPFDSSAPPAPMAAWMDAHHASPTYWNALGRDAGRLAGEALRGLEERGTEDPKEVLDRRARARDALAKADSDLWTTEARGFGGGRVMKRTLKVDDVAPPTVGKPTKRSR